MPLFLYPFALPTSQLFQPELVEAVALDGLPGTGKEPLVIGEIVDRQQNRAKHFAGHE
jgi:hypothetical protein